MNKNKRCALDNEDKADTSKKQGLSSYPAQKRGTPLLDVASAVEFPLGRGRGHMQKK